MSGEPNPRHRRPGSRWRLLVHEWVGRRKGSPVVYGTSHHVSSAPGEDGEHSAHHHLPGCDFDELVVGSWLHVEEMNSGLWWMDIGGVVVHVRVDRDGRPLRVVVHGPGDYNAEVPGVAYELAWRGHDDKHTGRDEEAGGP